VQNRQNGGAQHAQLVSQPALSLWNNAHYARNQAALSTAAAIWSQLGPFAVCGGVIKVKECPSFSFVAHLLRTHMLPPSDALALFSAPLSAVGAEVGRAVSHDLLATLPEAIRRGRLGEYLNDQQVQAEVGLSARQIRYLRERRAIPFNKVGRVVLYPTTELFRLIDAGKVPVREAAPG